MGPMVQAVAVEESESPEETPACHRNVRCDGCSCFPVVGVRYKCFGQLFTFSYPWFVIPLPVY